MKLEDLGYSETIERLRIENNLGEFPVGRVISEHRERYVVGTEKGELEAEITGNLRFSASSRGGFSGRRRLGGPDHLRTGFIHYPCCSAQVFSMISRQAVGKSGEIQIIATNVDDAFIVQAADRDFNINRLERYLTICYSSKVRPVIVLTKTDLISEEETGKMTETIRQRIKNIPILALSNETRAGYEALNEHLVKGKTYCMLGSSGVGKSSLLNNLTGRQSMKTAAISNSTKERKTCDSSPGTDRTRKWRDTH